MRVCVYVMWSQTFLQWMCLQSAACRLWSAARAYLCHRAAPSPQIDATVLGALLDPSRLRINASTAALDTSTDTAPTDNPVHDGISDAFAALMVPATQLDPVAGPAATDPVTAVTAPEGCLGDAIRQLVATAESGGHEGADMAGPNRVMSKASGGWSPQLPPSLHVCSPAWQDVDATHACEVHLDNLESFRCTPAYWHGAAGALPNAAQRAPHPAAAAAVLMAAAHVAGVAPPAGADPGAPLVPTRPQGQGQLASLGGDRRAGGGGGERF